MTIDLDVQRACACNSIPNDSRLQSWVETALHDHPQALLTIRIVDRAESSALNQRFRSRGGPTNVLSFPAEVPVEIDLPFLGDIVICAPLAAEEAAEQGKDLNAHWAHLVIHGVLHLLGFDHQAEMEAEEMEMREILLLASLGYPNPYV